MTLFAVLAISEVACVGKAIDENRIPFVDEEEENTLKSARRRVDCGDARGEWMGNEFGGENDGGDEMAGESERMGRGELQGESGGEGELRGERGMLSTLSR